MNPFIPERLDTKTHIKKFRLAPYFDAYWDEYIKHPAVPITPEQYKAVAAIRACRTEALGVDHYVCEECGEISFMYHSCKHRFCPNCSWKDTMKWADRMKNQLLNIPHRHVVFTLPHKLNDLMFDNKGILMGALLKTAAETIKDWMKHKYDIKPGIINVLHTAGEQKKRHPHVHMILSWGGINSAHDLEKINGDYVNYEFIQKKFRCKFEDKLIEAFDLDTLIHGFRNRNHFLKHIKHINKNSWRVHFEPSMSMPTQVIRYIGRYSKRACLSERKITNIDGEFISFKYKDNKNKDCNGKPFEKEITLHYTDFFPRLLQHVPIHNFRIVRYYAAYSARTKCLLKNQYYTPDLYAKSQDEDSATQEYELSENPKFCKTCNREKKYLYTTFTNKEGQRIYMTRFKPKKMKTDSKKLAA